MKTCELKINALKDRENVLVALANAGYKVAVDKRERPHKYLEWAYYVIVEDDCAVAKG